MHPNSLICNRLLRCCCSGVPGPAQGETLWQDTQFVPIHASHQGKGNAPPKPLVIGFLRDSI
jgi:hypothetical protein